MVINMVLEPVDLNTQCNSIKFVEVIIDSLDPETKRIGIFMDQSK